MSTVNVLCVVDAESLIQKYPGAAKSRQTLNHTQLHPYARMIAKQDNVLASQASDDLSIKVKQGDTVKWRAVSLTDDEEYKVDIDSFSSVDTGYTPFELGNTDTWVTIITSQSGSGADAYWVNFSVQDSNGKRYEFNWDPYITVV